MKKEKLYCDNCKKDVTFVPKLSGDICSKCRKILRPRYAQQVIYLKHEK